MKRINYLRLFIVLLLCPFLTGCKSNADISDTNIGTISPSSFGTYEWTSPDGVHYWVMKGYSQFGIAPRYDSDGKLVIDEEK